MDLKNLYVRYDIDSEVITWMKDTYGNTSNFDFLCTELYGKTYDGSQTYGNKVFSTDRDKAGNILVPTKIAESDLVLIAEDESASIKITGTSVVGLKYHGSNFISNADNLQNLHVTEDGTCIAQKQFRADYFANTEFKQIHKQLSLVPARLVDTVTQYMMVPIRAASTYVEGGKPGDFLLDDGTILSSAVYSIDWYNKIVGIVVSYDAEHDQGFAFGVKFRVGNSNDDRFCNVRTEDIKGIDTLNIDFIQSSIEQLSANSITLLKFLNYKKDNAALAAQLAKGTSEFPAYKYCSEYSSTGFEAGKWFLPTAALAYQIFENQRAIVDSLGLLGLKFNDQQFNIWTCIRYTAEQQFGISINSEISITPRYVDQTAYYNGLFPFIHFHQQAIAPFVEGDSIGDFLLNDGRILAKSAYKGYWLDKIEGVILSVTGEEGSKQYEIVSLNELKGSGTDYYFSSEKVLIPDMDTSTEGELKEPPVSISNPLLAFNDYRKNNAAISAQLAKGAGTYPAYSYCAAYETESITKGNWFLPTIVQLNKLHENRELLNDSLKLVFGDLLAKDENTWYWSCIQYNVTNEWVFYFGNDFSGNNWLLSYSTKDYASATTKYATRPIGIYTQASS